jgi:hypothetical protein
LCIRDRINMSALAVVAAPAARRNGSSPAVT